VLLWRRRFVFTVVHLGLPQKLGQRWNVRAADSSSVQPRFDLLQKPRVAVGIAERGTRHIGAAVRVWPRRRWRSEAGEMKRRAYIGAPVIEFAACSFDIGHYEIEILERARYRWGDSLAEVDRAR
jgi:hypothetical protein